MHILHKFFLVRQILIIIILLYWSCYGLAVIIYLKHLTHKYLFASKRDDIIGNKSLKNHQTIVEQLKDRECINVLILTGGGVRGYIQLTVLAEIEQLTGKKAGELFDFVSGASTGAISASSLTIGDENGGYKFSAKEVKDKYFAQLDEFFSAPWYHQYLTMFGLLAPRFLPDDKLRVLERYFGNATIGELKGNLLVPVYDIDTNGLKVIKNWDSPYGKINENYLAKDLINGASNPPMIFTPTAFSIKDKMHLFIDPAVFLNNPLLHVYSDVRMLFPDKHINLVFIGNGGVDAEKYDYRSMFGFGLYGVYQHLFSAPTISTKLCSDFMEDYLQNTSRYDNLISYYKITSIPEGKISPTNTNKKNLHKINKFAINMVESNKENIGKIAAALIENRK